MMRVLLDTNIILDVFLQREPFVQSAAIIWQANEQSQFGGYISAITPPNLFYIARKFKGNEIAKNAVREFVAAFRICAIDRSVLESALTMPLKDYEDSVQQASALANQLDAIITRDLKDFEGATILVLSPEEFLQRLSTSQGK